MRGREPWEVAVETARRSSSEPVGGKGQRSGVKRCRWRSGDLGLGGPGVKGLPLGQGGKGDGVVGQGVLRSRVLGSRLAGS